MWFLADMPSHPSCPSRWGEGGEGGALGASSALDKRTSPARTEACSAPPSELLRDYEGVSVSGCRVRARNTFDTTLRADLRHQMWIYTCCPTNNSFSLWKYVSLTRKSTVLKIKNTLAFSSRWWNSARLFFSVCLLMVWRIHPSKVGQSSRERLSVCCSAASRAVNKLTSWIRNKGNTRAASHGRSAATETLLEPRNIPRWIIDMLQAFNMQES